MLSGRGLHPFLLLQVPAENWFSAESFSQIFQQYLTLDTDQNGLLSPAEMCRQRGFTAEIIARLFEVLWTCCPLCILLILDFEGEPYIWGGDRL
jgi:hypothetical protein